MKIRKITSLTAALSFILTVVTSIVLYVVPPGRVSYWADWRFWGLTKDGWGNLHIVMGVLFLVALFLHIYYNWKPLISYLKDKKRNLKVWTAEFNIALVITLVFGVGAVLPFPPISWIMDANTWFKDGGSAKYGEPPYGHAELSSLNAFSQKMGLDAEKAVALLKDAGYPVTGPGDTLEHLARAKKVPPQKVYEVIQTARKAGAQPSPGGQMPPTPQPGTGNLSLADLCTQFGLNMKEVVGKLKEKGIVAAEKTTLKKIAEQNKISPTAVYEAIYAATQGE